MIGGCAQRLLRLHRTRNTDPKDRPIDITIYTMPILTAVLALVVHAIAEADMLALVNRMVYSHPSSAFAISVVVGLFFDLILEKLKKVIR